MKTLARYSSEREEEGGESTMSEERPQHPRSQPKVQKRPRRPPASSGPETREGGRRMTRRGS
jgi:hypothetical protein